MNYQGREITTVLCAIAYPIHPETKRRIERETKKRVVDFWVSEEYKELMVRKPDLKFKFSERTR